MDWRDEGQEEGQHVELDCKESGLRMRRGTYPFDPSTDFLSSTSLERAKSKGRRRSAEGREQGELRVPTHDSSGSDVPVRSEQDKLPYEVVENDVLDLLELDGGHGRRRGWGRTRGK